VETNCGQVKTGLKSSTGRQEECLGELEIEGSEERGGAVSKLVIEADHIIVG